MNEREQLDAIGAALSKHSDELAEHVSMLPLPDVINALAMEWARFKEREREEADYHAADDAAEAEFAEFTKTATPEQIDAALAAEGIDPVDVRKTAEQFGRFMPILFKGRERADAAEAKLAALADPRAHPDPTQERIKLAESRKCPVCLVDAGRPCNLWPEQAKESSGNSLGVHYERFGAAFDPRVAEHDDRIRKEGYAKAEADLQPLLFHPLRDRECKSCGGTGWIIFNNTCDCVDAAMRKQRAESMIADEARTVLLGITAARAAGFPLGELEERIMKLIAAEKVAEEKKA